MNAVVNWAPPADHLAPVYSQWALDVVDGSGVYLNTRDGRKVLDLYGGHAVAALGTRTRDCSPRSKPRRSR